MDDMCEVKETLLDHREKLHDIKEMQHEQNKGFSQHNKVTYSLMFLSGVVFGMSDAKWLPYTTIIYEFGKEVLKIGN